MLSEFCKIMIQFQARMKEHFLNLENLELTKEILFTTSTFQG